MKRRTRILLAISALAVLLPFGVANVGAATETRPSTAAAAGLTTSFDRVIDLDWTQRRTRRRHRIIWSHGWTSIAEHKGFSSGS